MLLRNLADLCGISYSSTAVDLASYMREVFKVYFDVKVKQPEMKLRWEIEVDESHFGTTRKYDRGIVRGISVWIVGFVERQTNRIILYPLQNREEAMMKTILLRHVEEGSTVMTDGWPAYNFLNRSNIHDFNVIHTEKFTQTYTNVTTGEHKVIHNNRIEGTWGIAKAKFRSIRGCWLSQMEGHLAELMWRNHQRGNRPEAFFELVKIYTLNGPPVYDYTTPLFDTWTVPAELTDHHLGEEIVRATNEGILEDKVSLFRFLTF